MGGMRLQRPSAAPGKGFLGGSKAGIALKTFGSGVFRKSSRGDNPNRAHIVT